LSVSVLVFLTLARQTNADSTNELLRNWDEKYRFPRGGEASPDYGKGINELKSAVITGISDTDLYYRLGFCHERRNDLDHARESFDTAIREHGNSPADTDLQALALYHIGMIHAKKGEYDRAIDCFAASLEINGDNYAAENNIGHCYRALSMRRKAVEHFQNALERNAGCIEAHQNLGVTYTELGEYDRAKRHFRAALDCDSPRRGSYISFARLLHAEGDEEGTHAVLSEGLERFPADGRLRRALALLQAGDDKRAEEKHQASRALLRQADRHYRNGEFKEAERIYKRILSTGRDNVDAWLNLGTILERSGRDGEAIDAFEHARSLDPSMKQVAYNLGLCYRKIGGNEKALKHLQEAITLDGDYADAYFQRALYYTEKRDFARAIADYEQVIRCNPADADAHFNLGQIYRVYAPDREAAVDHFSKFLALSPSSPDTVLVKDWIAQLSEDD
jgi:tetratricopeptide (TPR) repeat protein